MKKLLTSCLLLAGLVAASSCEDDEPTAASNTMSISGELNAANTPPTTAQPDPVVSSGMGTVSGTFVKAKDGTGELTYTVTYSNLTGPATNGHFHLGAPGTVGPVTVGFTNFQVSPITGKAVLTSTQVDELLKGNFYANIHTDKYKLGEIRANVVVK